MPTQIEMQAMSAQINQARAMERIAKALETIADSMAKDHDDHSG